MRCRRGVVDVGRLRCEEDFTEEEMEWGNTMTRQQQDRIGFTREQL